MKRLYFILAVILVIICVSGFGFSAAKAADTSNMKKCYTSVVIKGGDTLWSIAEEYCSPSIESVRDYVKNIKSLNHLTSDKITAGNHLSVYYYVEEND